MIIDLSCYPTKEVDSAWQDGIDAAAMKPDVDFDQHLDFALFSGHHPRPLTRDVQMIDDERQARAIEKRDHAVGI